MSEYVITINSTSDLPKEWVWEREIPVVPLNCTIGGKTYRDMYDLTAEEFYGMLENGEMAVTSQPSPQTAIDILEPILKKGKDILHLSFTSGLSGTYNSMCIAAEELREKYPERKIVVIDTLCASMGEGLLDYKALELQKEGRSLEEVAQWVEENKLKICHFFMVEDLNHLQKGGRISKTAAVIGTMVQIKPIICLDNEGKLQIIRKERGRKKGMNKIVDSLGNSAVAAVTVPVPAEHASADQESDDADDADHDENGFFHTKLLIRKWAVSFDAAHFNCIFHLFCKCFYFFVDAFCIQSVFFDQLYCRTGFSEYIVNSDFYHSCRLFF